MTIIATDRYQTSIDQVTYPAYGVTMDLQNPTGSAACAAAHDDLGRGTIYGSAVIETPGFSGSMPAVTFDLSGR